MTEYFDLSDDVNPYGPSGPPVSSPVGVPGIGLSIIRTFIPAVVGAIITVLAKIGAHVDSASLEVFISTVVTAVYYAGVRVLEVKVGPKFGWLLGAPKAPSY